MKKTGLFLMLGITIVFIGFLFGLFIGRSANGSDVPLSAYDSSLQHATVETAASVVPGKLDINKATAQELSTLPGIGDVIAQRIVDYRESFGPFTSIDNLLDVAGIGEHRLTNISDYITVGG